MSEWETRREGFRKYIANLAKDKTTGWHGAYPKVYWLQGFSDDGNTEQKYEPMKQILIRASLKDEEKIFVNTLPDNLFELKSEEFLQKSQKIDYILKNHKDDFKQIVLELANNQDRAEINRDYAGFKYGRNAMFKDYQNYLKLENEGKKKQTVSDLQMKAFKDKLLSAHNLILHGAPGTGKTYLAKKIAESLGATLENERLDFVQFHPSYDYTDFVEGLRPTLGASESGQLGFELRSGSFKDFCERAKYKVSKQGKSVDDIWGAFVENTVSDNIIAINNYKFHQNSKGNITYEVPGGSTASLTLENVKYYLENRKWGFKNYHSTYKQPIYDRYLKEDLEKVELVENDEKFVFIIDEINRGEISKIFGELFFAIDPAYRGEKGSVKTQYQNLHEDEAGFYVPENVYIIGTMNDIDRSVESFDFAMRRRFRFIELTAREAGERMKNDESCKYFDDIKFKQMNRLNEAIENIEGLSSHYHIGPDYFNKDLPVQEIWDDFIAPLLDDYLTGNFDKNEKLEELKAIYDDTTSE